MSSIEWNAPHAVALRPGDVIRGSGREASRESITPQAKALYRQLLQLGTVPAAELAALTRLTADRGQAAVHELADLGLIARQDGRVAAIPYAAAVDSLVAAESQALELAMETVQDTQRRLRVLIAEGAALGGDSAGTVLAASSVAGEDDASFEGARTRPVSDLAALHPGVRFSAELLESSLKRAEAHLVEGVRLRVIHQRAAMSHPRSAEYFHRIEQLGGQVRLRDHLPFRLMLIDGLAAVCRLTWQDGLEDTLLLQGPHMLGLLGRLFETTWLEAVPLAEVAGQVDGAGGAGAWGDGGGPVPGLTTQHRAIMRYLADGATDQAIARFLGITTRTVTRRVNEIYQTLGVQSRFQAGVVARHMGLI